MEQKLGQQERFPFNAERKIFWKLIFYEGLGYSEKIYAYIFILKFKAEIFENTNALIVSKVRKFVGSDKPTYRGAMAPSKLV